MLIAIIARAVSVDMEGSCFGEAIMAYSGDGALIWINPLSRQQEMRSLLLMLDQDQWVSNPIRLHKILRPLGVVGKLWRQSNEPERLRRGHCCDHSRDLARAFHERSHGMLAIPTILTFPAGSEQCE